MKLLGTQPMPTPSWIGLFTTLIGSNSPAKACAGSETGKPKRLDPTRFLSNTESRKPASLPTRATSFRYGGRHHSGIPGDIISFYPGGFVVIGTPGYWRREKWWRRLRPHLRGRDNRARRLWSQDALPRRHARGHGQDPRAARILPRD